MSEILDRIKQVASIEEIEAEQQQLRDEQASRARQIEALEVYRKALLIERDGKVERKVRKGKESSPRRHGGTEEEQPDAVESLPELPAIALKGDDPKEPAVLRCLNLLNQSAPLAIGEISRILSIPYGTIHHAIKSDSRFTVALGKWTVKGKRQS